MALAAASGLREGGRRVRQPVQGRPTVSVITVAYNSVEPLRKTLDSVRGQRWSAIGHIVIDGGSSDGSVELLAARGDELEYWRSEPDQGIYDAMSKGLALARGEHILFLNSGDLLRGTVLFPGMDFGRLLPVAAPDFWGHGRRLRLKDVRLGMPYCHQGILFRNDQLMPFVLEYRIAADYEFLLANLDKAGLDPPSPQPDGFVEFDMTGVSNTRVLQRDLEAARIVRHRYGAIHWTRFWLRQGPKLAVRWLVGRLRGGELPDGS